MSAFPSYEWKKSGLHPPEPPQLFIWKVFLVNVQRSCVGRSGSSRGRSQLIFVSVIVTVGGNGGWQRWTPTPSPAAPSERSHRRVKSDHCFIWERASVDVGLRFALQARWACLCSALFPNRTNVMLEMFSTATHHLLSCFVNMIFTVLNLRRTF